MVRGSTPASRRWVAKQWRNASTYCYTSWICIDFTCLRPALRAKATLDLSLPRAVDTFSVSTRTPCTRCLHRREDRSAVEIGPLDNPRGRWHHLACGQYPVPNEPLEYCFTDSEVLRGLRTRQPVGALGEIR
jgi:hypothetical protein